MKFSLVIFVAALAFTLPSQGAAVGDVQIGVKSDEGPLTPVWITKTAGKVIGWNESGVLGPITVSTAFSDLTGKPTTLAGYGISDSITAALAASTYEPIITTGSLALSKLATNPLARANHTGTQLLSTISDAGSLAALSAVGSAQITDGSIVNADISSSAAIADAKISSASTWNAKESALTFSTGLTRSINTITVNTAQSITRLSNLTSNGFVKTSGANGTLTIDTSTYLTGNQAIALSGDASGSGTTAINVTLANSGATAGTYGSATESIIQIVDTKGRVTSITTNPITPPVSAITGLGAGVSTALANAVNASGGVLTYALIGTSGTKIPLLDAANTFASGQRFGGASGDYIALASSGTRELRFSSNGFSLGSSSWLLGMYDSGSLASPSGSSFFFESTALFRGDAQFYGNLQWTNSSKLNNAYGSYHAILYEGANAQRLSVMNTYSSSTSYEAAGFDWQTVANVCRIGTFIGSGGGTARDVSFIHGGTEKMRVSSGGVAVGNGGTPHAKIKSGVATLESGVVTVYDADVFDDGTPSTASRIFITRMTDGGAAVGDSYSVTRSSGYSFTITSMTGGTVTFTDASKLSWLMINP